MSMQSSEHNTTFATLYFILYTLYFILYTLYLEESGPASWLYVPKTLGFDFGIRDEQIQKKTTPKH